MLTSAGKNALLLPALRAKMGLWIYYVGFMKLSDVAERISIVEDIHTSKTLQDLLQRQLGSRSSEIAAYLLQHEQRFFSSLVVGTYGGSPEWIELSVTARSTEDERTLFDLEGKVGFLRLTGKEVLFALDGQHRVAGIKEAIIQSDELKSDEVSIIIVSGVSQKHRAQDPVGFERTRRLFTTLNSHAKPVSKRDIIALDEDDAVAILTRKLVEEHKLFKGRTSAGRGNSIPPSDRRSFTTIVNLYDVLDLYLKDQIGQLRYGKNKRPTDVELASIEKAATDMWAELIRAFPPLGKLVAQEKSVAGRYRTNKGGHLLFRPIGLKMVVQTVVYLQKDGNTLRRALSRIKKAEFQLGKSPWAGLIWNTSLQKMITAADNQKAATKLLYYSVGGDLKQLRTSPERLTEEVAGLMNITPDTLELPMYV